MDPDRIEPALTERTRAILCVHQLGMPCDLARIVDIGLRHRIPVPVIEDAACAIGSEILWNGQWEKIGRPRGQVACFSFHPRKVITTGDGGMITTADAELDRKFRLWRQHSMSVPDTVRHSAGEVVFESYPEIGYNYRMTDMQAAVGRVQLTRLPAIVEERRAIAREYTSRLTAIPGVRPPQEPSWARSNWQSYCVELPDGCDQRSVMQALLDGGISTRRGVMNSHLEHAYHTPCGPSLPHSTYAQQHGVILPLVAGMTPEQVERVCDALWTCRTARGRRRPHLPRRTARS
jgi:dTDP-4-amino-4,6-dideoxygalactose transaminase